MTTTPPKRTSIVFAGEEIPAQIRTEDGTLREALIRVRAMPARHLGRILQLCLDEAALLEFVCLEPTPDQGTEAPDQPMAFRGWRPVPPAWADNLTDESHALLWETAKRLNFTRAASWGERQIDAKAFQAPLLMRADETMAPVVAKMVGLITSSLKSSGSLAAPSTPS